MIETDQMIQLKEIFILAPNTLYGRGKFLNIIEKSIMLRLIAEKG